jgi:hypothetical protein
MKKMDGMTALILALLFLVVIWVLSNGAAVTHMLNTMSTIGK